MSDFTDEDVAAGAQAIDEAHVECYGRWDASHAVLAAVLPAYRARVLREAADAADDWEFVGTAEWLRARADAEGGK